MTPTQTTFPQVASALAKAPAARPAPAAGLGGWLGATHCMDCLELMRQLPAESIGVVVTSPPYNLRNNSSCRQKSYGGKWVKPAVLVEGYEEHNDNMPDDEYIAWQRDCLSAMMRVLRPDGAIFYNHKWRVQDGLLQDRSAIVDGFPVRQIIIWQRSGGHNFTPRHFLATYEVIYLIAKPDFKLAAGANSMTDVWRVGQEINTDHPAPFPVEIPQRCIKATTASVVLDPFMGSGSTAVAAAMEGREWLGAELAQGYCDMARQRVEQAQGLMDKYTASFT